MFFSDGEAEPTLGEGMGRQRMEGGKEREWEGRWKEERRHEVTS